MTRLLSITSAFVIILNGCGTSVYYVKPKDWATPATVDSVIMTYRPFLQGRRIFLDPGHGGEDRKNRGSEGDAIEADVNLRVALALRDYLNRTGSIVSMSRTTDTTVALKDRPDLAANTGAELFISLHHNATGTGDQVTNYSATYYHASEGHPDYHPANHDIARYIQRDMSYAMRNASPPFSPTFDGTLSDFGVYPNSGFAVLRHSQIPAVLVEASFFTHPHEEQRLAREEFNHIEAWGIFQGLGKYFRAGFPQLSLLSDSVTTTPWPRIVVGIDSREGINPTTTHVSIDGKPVFWSFDDSTRHIDVSPGYELKGGTHDLEAWAANKNGNTSWPFKRRILVKLPPASLTLQLHPDELPPSDTALVRVICAAKDKNGELVADGTLIRFEELQKGIDTVVATKGGFATLYVYGSRERKPSTITATSSTESARIALGRTKGSAKFITGIVRSSTDSSALAGVELLRVSFENPDSSKVLDTTWSDGRYIICSDLPDSVHLSVRKPGFFTEDRIIHIRPGEAVVNVSLTPVAQGRLFGKTYLIDPRYGGIEPGVVSATGLRSADLNLEIALRLKDLLLAAGASPVLMRAGESSVAEGARAKRSADFSEGLYLRIDASGKEKEASCQIYSSLLNAAVAGHLLGGLKASAALDSAGIFASQEKFYYEVSLGTINVVLPSAGTDFYAGSRSIAVEKLAWGLFLGILKSEGHGMQKGDTYRVTDRASGRPLAGTAVTLNETLTKVADEYGIVDFFGLVPPVRRVQAKGSPEAVVIQEGRH